MKERLGVDLPSGDANLVPRSFVRYLYSTDTS